MWTGEMRTDASFVWWRNSNSANHSWFVFGDLPVMVWGGSLLKAGTDLECFPRCNLNVNFYILCQDYIKTCLVLYQSLIGDSFLIMHCTHCSIISTKLPRYRLNSTNRAKTIIYGQHDFLLWTSSNIYGMQWGNASQANHIKLLLP